MYELLIPLHSYIRWILLTCLLYSILKSILGLKIRLPYSAFDNTIHLTASIVAHLQLIIGFILYFKSPIVLYLRTIGTEGLSYSDVAFFGVYHITFMVVGILLIIIGTAKAKKALTDKDKHTEIFTWYGFAMLFIVAAIPWPFSPYVSRPYFRMF
jgi:hypothetical protein